MVETPSAESSTREDSLEDLEEEEFHDCCEMETVYLSFDNLELNTSPSNPAEGINEQQKRSDSEGFYSCDGQSNNEESRSVIPVDLSETEEKRRMAFVPRRIDSNGEIVCGEIEDRPEEPETTFNPCTLPDGFVKDENASDVLVTLTTTDMGISAKRQDSGDMYGLQIGKSVFDGWNVDSIPDSSIFDKAKLREEALDTADINKCMARTTAALPSLRIQEQYSDELRSITKHSRYSTRGSSLSQMCPTLPSYRMETMKAQSGIYRVNSAPMEFKDTGVAAEDKEISCILNNEAFSPWPSSTDRPMSSLSEPFEELVQLTPDGYKKKCLTTWVQKKIRYVSFDTESDVASITRSEFIMEMKQSKERREAEGGFHRSQPSSRFCYINGYVTGPSVSPVQPADDFTRENAVALNAVLRNDPQLSNVPMGQWTSKLIGFATPADYYVYMIYELSKQNINVLALIKSVLGESHHLVLEIIEKLKNYTEEVPAFVLDECGQRGHRRGLPPISSSSRRFASFSRRSEDFHQSVEAALVNCGLNVASFEKTRSSFQTDVEYFEYISSQIKAAGFYFSIPKLRTLLGENHPFIEILKSTLHEPETRSGSMTDSARSIQSGNTPKSSPRHSQTPRSMRQARSSILDGVSEDFPTQIIRNESDEVSPVKFCWLSCFYGWKKRHSISLSKRH